MLVSKIGWWKSSTFSRKNQRKDELFDCKSESETRLDREEHVDKKEVQIKYRKWLDLIEIRMRIGKERDFSRNIEIEWWDQMDENLRNGRNTLWERKSQKDKEGDFGLLIPYADF